MNVLTKFTPVAAALLLSLGSMTGAQAEITSDNLSVSGFIDMSYLSIDVDGAGSTHDSGIDQVELNFGYDFGNKLTATVDSPKPPQTWALPVRVRDGRLEAP